MLDLSWLESPRKAVFSSSELGNAVDVGRRQTFDKHVGSFRRAQFLHQYWGVDGSR